MKNNIVLIIPFFGEKFPLYFDFWLHSLEGRHLDVLLVTDMSDMLRWKPSNVRVLRMSLPDVRALAEKKIGQPVALDSVRKLCDLKPMYGKIFEDEIVQFGHWAFGDADLVYGREIDSWLDFLLPQGFDVLCFRERWTSGPFCILRNDEKCRTLFARARHLKEMLANPACTLFDELSWNGGFDGLTWDRMTMADCERHEDSFSAVVWRSTDVKRFAKELICEVPLWTGMVRMEKGGRLTLDNLEVPIFHMVRAKQNPAFTLMPWAGPEEYRIDKYGFYTSMSQWRFRAVLHAVRTLRANGRWLANKAGALKRHDMGYFVRKALKKFRG